MFLFQFGLCSFFTFYFQIFLSRFIRIKKNDQEPINYDKRFRTKTIGNANIIEKVNKGKTFLGRAKPHAIKKEPGSSTTTNAGPIRTDRRIVTTRGIETTRGIGQLRYKYLVYRVNG